MTLLVRTIVSATEVELRSKVEAARADGWQAIGNPGHLLIGGAPAKGQASWVQHMSKS